MVLGRLGFFKKALETLKERTIGQTAVYSFSVLVCMIAFFRADTLQKGLLFSIFGGLTYWYFSGEKFTGFVSSVFSVVIIFILFAIVADNMERIFTGKAGTTMLCLYGVFFFFEAFSEYVMMTKRKRRILRILYNLVFSISFVTVSVSFDIQDHRLLSVFSVCYCVLTTLLYFGFKKLVKIAKEKREM